MRLHNLSPMKRSVKERKRVGRGPGSGLGKTAGRGHKGQKSRSGYSRKWGFEGGQMPLYRRVPKRGFKNSLFAKEYHEVNLKQIAPLRHKVITPEVLKEKGIIKKLNVPVKVLSVGELKRAYEIHAHKFSKKAKEKIEEAGGKAVEIGG